MRSLFIGASTRPTTRSWSSPATSRRTRSRRWPRRPTARSRRASPIGPRVRPKEPVQEASRTVTLADPRVEQPSVSRYLSRHLRARPRSRARLRRSTCWRTCSAAAPTAGSIARWWSTRASRSTPAPTIRARRSTTASSASTARPSPGITLQDVEAAIDAVIAEVIDKGITAEELDRAKNRLIADAVYAQDNQATLARWFGAALATGETVEQVRTWPDRIHAVECRRRARGRAPLARPPLVGDRLSRQEPAARGETLVNHGAMSFIRRASRGDRPRGAGAALVSLAALRRTRPRSSASSARAASRPGWCTSRLFR